MSYGRQECRLFLANRHEALHRAATREHRLGKRVSGAYIVCSLALFALATPAQGQTALTHGVHGERDKTTIHKNLREAKWSNRLCADCHLAQKEVALGVPHFVLPLGEGTAA